MSEASVRHEPTFVRFQRGVTPVRPRRPLYGWIVRCSCGASERVNGRKPEARRRFRAHLESVAPR